MKQIILALLLIISFSLKAQWNQNGNHVYNTNTGSVGIGLSSPSYKFDVEGPGVRFKNSSTAMNAYTTFRIQGPHYTHGLEIDFFGNNNLNQPPEWSYGGGPGSAAIMNVNPKPLIFGTGNICRILIDGSGNVGIGTLLASNPNSYKLAVNGKIGAKEVQVENTSATWADYVFDADYNLRTIYQVEEFIKDNGHLPEIPSKEEVEQQGHKLGEMDVLLLKKVEELTLYIIELKKEIDELKSQLD